MTTICNADPRCIELIILDLPTILSKSNKNGWQKAFAAVRCLRAFSSLFKEVVAKNKSKLYPSPSQTPQTALVIDIAEVETRPCFSNIDQSSFRRLVKEKNLEQIVRFGGIEGLASALNTDVKHGIPGDAEDIAHRHEAFGTNIYRKPPTKSFFHFVWDAFRDPTILILLVCAALSLAFGIKEHGPKQGWYDGGSIFVAVYLFICISAGSNFRQNRKYDEYSDSKVSNNIPVQVVRSGRPQQISIFQIVVGDVVCLKIGDQIPADGLFLDGQSVQVDESSITGESVHAKVNASHNPFLFSGTKVVDGYARMLVTSVGMHTTCGEMMSTINRDSDEQTPLQARLNKLTSSIGKVGLAVAFLVFLVLLVRYFTGNTKDENGKREFNGCKMTLDDLINPMVATVAPAVTIVMVAIPEGLRKALTLTIAYSMRSMMADQVMVRKLSAYETMGFATTICTDKTGTLTMNQMNVTKFWLGLECKEERSSTSIAADVLKLLHQGVGLNTTGSVYKPTPGTEFEFSGSPTEKAILSWATLELNMDMEELKQHCTILHAESFNSENKRSGVLMRKKADNTINVHWKGAAEMILAMCSHFYDPSGNMKALGDDERMKFNQIIESMAASSLRCIAFAQKEVPEEEHEDGVEHHKLKDNGLTLLGLVGLKDLCQPGAKKAVEDCQHARVNIKMITGDNVFTARSIATECGILGPNQDVNGAVVEGVEFRNYTPEERIEKVDKICVMARSSPFDKLLMVQCLKQKGHVVAVTGDGTNDGPVLKEADIGLSMGIRGTEVAKESSDIVILDDNLASVATALRWGRFVHNNIQKFIQFQLTVNVAALVINFVAAVSAGEVPLTAVQLLWVNLIMDTLGALALATEQPTKELMERPPVGRIEPLITNIMWRNLLAQALYQIAVLLTLQFKGESIFGINQKVNDTLIFNTFVLCQVFNEFNARKLEKKNVFEGIHRNKLFLGIVGITIILQVAMVEFLKKFADTERLNWGQWGACIGIAVISWPIDWFVKCIPVAEKPFFNFFSINQSSLNKSSLTKLVNERNREQLRQHGGTDAIVLALKSDAENGINGDIDDIACRQKAFGANIYQKPPKVVHFVLDVFKDPIILILFVCAALSLGFGIKKHGLKEGWHEGGSIFVSLLLVITVSAVNRSWPNRQFNKLSAASNRIQIDVIRNGKQQHISVSDIVVGDVVCLQIGDQVPANGLYLNGHSLKVNESDMTGQNDLVEVNLIQNPFLLVGTKVANGYARMLVTSVGMNTAWSKMRYSNEQTPLQVKLEELTSSISKAGLSIAFVVLVVLLTRYFMGNIHGKNGNMMFIGGKTNICDVLRAIVGILATPVVIAAAAIPEGLLLAFRITVAYSTKKMADDQALVKKLSACERIGSMTVICTDLTGGLNHRKVTEFWLRQKYIKECAASQIASEVLELLHQGFGLNTNQAPSGSVFELSDKAVYKWGVHPSMKTEELCGTCTILEVFNLEKKQSGVLIRKKTDNTIHEHLKGAPEVILPMFSHYRDEDDNGTIKVIDNGARMKLDKIIEGMVVKGLQCIAFAHKQMPKDDNDELRLHPKLKEDGLTLIGFVGLEVPCQLGVREAITDCQDAGVKIKMITGDDISTARSIANECGIIETNQYITTDVVVEGVEFRTCTHEERMEKVDKICVMARASPSDKLLMVQCLKQKGHVVAVIEDGTGDEEVLGAADISLSLRIQGTDMANERSDVVILGSNFDSIVTALRWSRGIYNNIQIFTQLQLTVCIASLVMDFVTPVSASELPTINIITAISTGEVPYATLQLLWVKLIVGTLTALAFTIEQPTRELHQMPCVDPNAPFITNIMWTSIMGQGLYQIAIMLTIHFKGESIFHVNAKVRDTMVFNISVLCQVFMMFSMRKFEKNVFKEIERRKLYWAIIGIIIILQLVMVEFLKGAAGTERLDWAQWGACTGIAAVSWPLGLLVKFIPLPEKPFLSYLKQQKLSRASSPSGSRAVSPPSRSGV